MQPEVDNSKGTSKMTKSIPQPLFILEMANNHMGDLAHGLLVVRRFGEICRKFPQFYFAFKLQYRDLDSFIHPSMKGRDDVKYVKRFSETRLEREQFDSLVSEIRNNGFIAISTPFDEPSVDLIESQQLDIIKIASCSFTDWPLLERIVRTEMPIIASTAGATLEEIERVISFFTHRNKSFAIMHCVGEYPTRNEHLHLSQIDYLKSRFPEVMIGFSTHEDPNDTDIIKIAVAKGASVFEKHVGAPTARYPVNAYSASPEQFEEWLSAAARAYSICGVGHERLPFNEAESASLRSLRRGIFARRDIGKGELIRQDDIYFAFPPEEGQFTANDWSKYVECITSEAISANCPISPSNAVLRDLREQILEIAHGARSLLNKGGIAFPGCTDLEISHHYGIDRFREFGLTMLTIVNRAYCKKLLILFPGQKHPEQYHKTKEETFHILYGTVQLELDGRLQTCAPGDVVIVAPGVRHAFWSDNGAVIEEISSTHLIDDSFYTDATIDMNKNRKTLLSYWLE